VPWGIESYLAAGGAAEGALSAEAPRRGEASGKAGLWETRPRVSAAATTSRSGDSEPERPRRRVRRGPVSAAAAGLGEEEEVGSASSPVPISRGA
jgi:hypothetical protein